MKNKNMFDKFIDLINNLENSFVNLIAKLIPILVPLIPAYVSYNHVLNELGFSQFFALTYAGVVEGLGYASIYRAVQFWEWNRRFSKEEKKSPLWLAIGIYVFYLFVILWVNVMLDWQTGVMWYKIVAVGAISLLSVPAGLLLSISAIHNERVKEHEDSLEQARIARAEAKREREQENAKKPVTKENPVLPKDWRTRRPQMPIEDVVAIARISSDEAIDALAKQEGVDPKTVKNWIGYARAEFSDYTTAISKFIKYYGRLPNNEEISVIGLDMRDVARFIKDNKTALLSDGLATEELISRAEKSLE